MRGFIEREISRRALLFTSASASRAAAMVLALPTIGDARTALASIDEPVLPLLAERERLIQASLTADRKMIEAHGTPERDALDAAALAASDRWQEFEHVIAETPATTLAGVIGKLAIAAEVFECNDRADELHGYEHCLVAAFDDLRALAAKISTAR